MIAKFNYFYVGEITSIFVPIIKNSLSGSYLVTFSLDEKETSQEDFSILKRNF